MFEPLRYPCGRALLLFYELLQAIALLAEGRKLFLQLGAIPEKLDELLIIVTVFACSPKDWLTARHIRSLDIIRSAPCYGSR